MAYKGMDDAQLEASANQLSTMARSLDALVIRCDVLVGQVSNTWHGQDSQAFRDEWNSTHRRSLTRVTAEVHGMVDLLRRNIAAQRDTSQRLDGGGAAVGSGRAGSPGSATEGSGWGQATRAVNDFINGVGLNAAQMVADFAKVGGGGTRALGSVFGVLGLAADWSQYTEDPSGINLLHVGEDAVGLLGTPGSLLALNAKTAEAIGTHLAEGQLAGNYTPEAAVSAGRYLLDNPASIIGSITEGAYVTMHDLTGVDVTAAIQGNREGEAALNHAYQSARDTVGAAIRTTDFSPEATRTTASYVVEHPSEAFQAGADAVWTMLKDMTGGGR